MFRQNPRYAAARLLELLDSNDWNRFLLTHVYLTGLLEGDDYGSHSHSNGYHIYLNGLLVHTSYDFTEREKIIQYPRKDTDRDALRLYWKYRIARLPE